MKQGQFGLRKQLGFAAGIALFAALLVIPPPGGLSEEGWRTAAVAALMTAWWVGEPIPLPATALLPLALFPVLGIGTIDTAAAPYANPLIFLFLGGFLLALAMERWSLHRRIALRIIRAVGTRPRRIVAGFMGSGAFLSLWMSNTATTLLLLPIGLSVLALAEDPQRADSTEGTGAAGPSNGVDPDFAPALLLAIAFSASIGGIGTLIGTPPNALTAAFLYETYGIEIGFVRWMAIGVPVMAVALPLAYVILTRIAFPIGTREIPGARELVERELDALGRLSRGERWVALVFAFAVIGWVAGPLLQRSVPGISDAGVAVAAALALFVLPVDLRRGEFVLNWQWARRVPWEVLLLFGGGLSLAAAIDGSGLAAWVAAELGGLATWPVFALIVAVVASVILFSELASNTATAATFLPIVGALALSARQDPILLVIPAGLAASGGFMLPVATPPNAIVYGTGKVSVPQLVRAGAFLDLAFVLLVPLVARFLVPLFFR